MKKRICQLLLLLFLLTACSSPDTATSSSALSASTASEESSAALTIHFDATTDFDGKSVDPSIFAQYDLTVINLWATWCGPCKHELPDLGKIAKEYADKKINVIGICSDVQKADDPNMDTAKKLLKDAGCTYTNLVMNDSIQSVFFDGIPGIPATILVNSKGEVVDQPVVGARSYESFKSWIEEAQKGLAR